MRGSGSCGENVLRMWEGSRSHRRMTGHCWEAGWPQSMQVVPVLVGGRHRCHAGCWKQGQQQGGVR